jgi:hypothetical protein
MAIKISNDMNGWAMYACGEVLTNPSNPEITVTAGEDSEMHWPNLWSAGEQRKRKRVYEELKIP